MNRVQKKRYQRQRSHKRLRRRIRGTAARPRLAVFKSLKFVYAQVIDDDSGQTVAQASSLEISIREKIKGGCCNRAAAKAVGEAVAERAKEKGVSTVVFDRGGYIYHGKIQELADAARSKGLEF